MSVQVRRRREAAAFLSTFVGAQGELIVDTTNNRVQVHDGATPGGFPAAKLADVAQRAAVADANYTALATDRTVAFTAITAARVVTLSAASAYPTGTQLVVVDESGACSATNTITVNRVGADTINGAASAVVALPYGFVALVSSGAGKWTLVDQSTASLAQQASSNVAITGGTIAGLSSLATTPSGTLSVGSTTVGGVVSANRFFTMDTSGRATYTYSDNSVSVIQKLQNGAITAANQGASFADIYFGPSVAGLAQSGRFAMLTKDTYATSANRSSFWLLSAELAGTLTTCMYFDPGVGNRSFIPLVPGADNTITLGSAAARWSQLYAGSAVIQTSDAREKTEVTPLGDRELAAAIALAKEIGTFRFLAAVSAKGERARTHVGLTVQGAMETMRAHELDPLAYAFICHDTWDAVPDVAAVPAKTAVEPVLEDVLDIDGKPTGERREIEPGQPAEPAIPAVPGHPAGDRYGFRIDQLLMFLARGFDARLAALEAR